LRSEQTQNTGKYRKRENGSYAKIEHPEIVEGIVIWNEEERAIIPGELVFE